MMSSQETTPIPVDKQQLVTCGRGPNFQHRGHLCKSRDLNASHFLSLNRKRPFFSYTNRVQRKKKWKFHTGITWNWSYFVLFAWLYLRGIRLGKYIMQVFIYFFFSKGAKGWGHQYVMGSSMWISPNVWNAGDWNAENLEHLILNTFADNMLNKNQECCLESMH